MTSRIRRLTLILAAVLAIVLVRWCALTPYVVETDSMSPTLDAGDVAVIDRLSPRWADLGRNDLLVFRRGDELVLKRVVGVPGDVVAIRDALLYVNAKRVREPYVDHATIDGVYFGPVEVPPGHVFVLGDRREGSIDSRTYGPVPLSAVQGRVLVHW